MGWVKRLIISSLFWTAILYIAAKIVSSMASSGFVGGLAAVIVMALLLILLIPVTVGMIVMARGY